jgi:O-antigen/teichoic acid export membrane protein
MKLKKYLKNDVIIASLALLILTNLASLMNFLFQFIMARALTVEDFGTLAFISSLTFLFSVPSFAIQTIIAKKTTELNLNKMFGKIRGLFNSATKKLFIISFILFLAFSVLAYFTSPMVNISLDILLWTGTMIIFSFLIPIVLGIMQGMKKFSMIGWNNILNYSIKLVLGIILVLMGFKIYGALGGILIGSLVAWISGTFILKNYKPEKQEFSLYSRKEFIPFMALLIITLMSSLDILVGKFLLPSDLFGNYAKISLIGKIIIFACLSVCTVMFPLSSERHINKTDTSGIFRKALYLTSLICIASIIGTLIMPKLIITILFGIGYISLANLLLPIVIAFSSISFISLIVTYRISVNRFNKKFGLILGMLLIIQALILIVRGNSPTNLAFGLMNSSLINLIVLILISIKWRSQTIAKNPV